MRKEAPHIAAAGSFDDLRSRQVRFLEEASRLGNLEVLLWSDETVRAITGKEPKFPHAERLYFLESLRYVQSVRLVDSPLGPDALPADVNLRPDAWVVEEAEANKRKQAFCQSHQIELRVIPDTELAGFPSQPYDVQKAHSGRKRVVVTGCYDWLHSGHVRFFEEVSALGDLVVVVGQDANVRQLKGEGHPLIPEAERRYMVQSIRYVTQALISTGFGWMDAAPEIERLKPDIYAVNEDGDQPEKRVFCQEHGLEYVVLKRLPKEGLPKRQSTVLRGF